MTVEQTQKVFDPFTQADVTTTRKYGGTGLGLAIVSRFCDLMGGSVWVESRPGEGSRFVVRLPREAKRPQPSRWRPPAREPATRREQRNPMATILVVEDNEPSRDALARRLQRRGYDVVVAVDGQQAVSVAQSAKPDLILMDLGLPVIDGWEATRQLKADASTQHIPIIVLSAHAMTNDRDLALAAGGDDFDTKPVRFQPLIDKIASLLARSTVQ